MKKDIPYKIEKLPSLVEATEQVPEQTLKENSWVLILSGTDMKESKVYVFNNEEVPDDLQYASFKDWAELSVDDLSIKYEFKSDGRFGKIHIDPFKFKINAQGKEEADGWSRLDCTEGYNAQVIHIYNGEVTQENLQSKVNLCYSCCGDIISDYCDNMQYQEELQRERYFRP